MNTPAFDPKELERELKATLAGLLEQARMQTSLLERIHVSVELEPCLLDKIGQIACLTANEVHQHTIQLRAIRQAFDALVELYRSAHPDAAATRRECATRADSECSL
jgi:hypothetical protein